MGGLQAGIICGRLRALRFGEVNRIPTRLENACRGGRLDNMSTRSST